MTGHGKPLTQKEGNVPALRIGMKFMHKLSRRPRRHKSSVSRCHRRKGRIENFPEKWRKLSRDSLCGPLATIKKKREIASFDVSSHRLPKATLGQDKSVSVSR